MAARFAARAAAGSGAFDMSGLKDEVLDELCAGACALAVQASKAIMEIYSRGCTVQSKADRSPLTEADTAAHSILEHGLKQLAPRLPVLSEESSARVFADRHRWARYWLVDPLDGTREFINKNNEFSVNIALVEHGVAVIGVIAAPAKNQLVLAHRGIPTRFLRLHQSQAAIALMSEASELAEAHVARATVRVGVSRSHHPAEIQTSLNRLGQFSTHALGSALKFLAIAEKSLDIYPRLKSSSSEWDIAAGQCIVEQSGGAVLGLDGLPLRYNQRADLLVPAFIACADPSRDWLAQLGWGANKPEQTTC
jgi:3'(2'), 5'-bisphosphate nucleotidase